MALLSIVPLASKSWLHKSFISSAHELNPFRRTIPTLGGKTVRAPISMCSATAVSGDGVQIRTANHRSNLWDDDFIQSLSTPYQAPSYLERAERLIEEVKEMFASFSVEDGVLITPLNDLISRLSVVDSIERLGIDRHFKTEIKSALDYVYRWNPSATEFLPEYMKRVYMVLYETVNELARDAEKSQGRDTINNARQAWEAHIDSYMKEAEWISSGCLPTFEEYYENGKVNIGYRISKLQPILTLDIPFPHHILQEIEFPSKFNNLASDILRLIGDTRGYKADRFRGEEVSCISCYMKKNPELTEENVVSHIHSMVNELIKELNWELLKPDNNVPISSKKYAFDIARADHHGYKYQDGFSVASNEMKNLVMITVLQPVPL